MSAIGEIIKGKHGGHPVLKTSNGRTRVALPMAYVETCVSKIEEDFLWRFYEAWSFTQGITQIVDEDGKPIGRYEDYAEEVDPESYVRLEVQAYRWVRQYALGREWEEIAEIWLRMMAQRFKATLPEVAARRLNTHDERIALGGGQMMTKDLGLRLKDAYRDFFRWYRYVKDCAEKGRDATVSGAFDATQRETRIANQIERFKVKNRLHTQSGSDV